MEMRAWGSTIGVHMYQSQLLGMDPGIVTPKARIKEAELGGKTLLNKKVKSRVVRNPVEKFVHIFSLNYSHHSFKRSFKSKFCIRCLNNFHGVNWRLNELDKDAIKDELRLWLQKVQTFWNGMTYQLEKSTVNKIPNTSIEKLEMELDFMVESTIDSRNLKGGLSPEAVISIEQFSRLNGLTGRKMQAQFEAHTPTTVHNEVRNLVEYCCFLFLAREDSDIHPSLKDSAFRRLMFITMLAWQYPYYNDSKSAGNTSKNASSLKRMLVREEAFVRIAPAIPGVADRPTSHHLFRALAGDKKGLSLDVWDAYLSEILRVHEGRKFYCFGEGSKLDLSSKERILCIGASSKRPVLKWDKNFAWPGRLTLTDHALYFEANDLTNHQKAIRLDLTKSDAQVEKKKVGPLGILLFDSAISVSSSSKSDIWTLDFQGEMRRDIWHAFIEEIISLHAFIQEYGPDDSDPSVSYVYGANKGKSRATTSIANGIAKLQSLQSTQEVTMECPLKNAQFSYLKNAPDGDLVYQTLAVEFWGGYIDIKAKNIYREIERNGGSTQDVFGTGHHAIGSDGSVYVHKWMRSQSWSTRESVAFWKHNSGRQALVIGKNLVVGDLNLVERAVLNCKEKSQIYQKTQATIDAALIKGIPSNIDLVKELMLPLTVIASNFRKLIQWEQPPHTISFLAVVYILIYKNWTGYIFPFLLIVGATTMVVLKSLKAQGRLGRSFGKVTLKAQPPSNTIQKIVALKEALAEMEYFLQNINVALLKLRTIFVTGQTQVTNEIAVALLGMAIVMIIFPFKYLCTFLVLDLFTRELKLRQKMVLQFVIFLKNRWATIPAAPVVVLPSESSGMPNTVEDDSDIGQDTDIAGENHID